MRATVKDVAALAGVSPKTVSNVITGAAPVREATRERVESALAELDYVPNLSARGLRNGRTGLIALALPDLATSFSAEMVHLVVEDAHERGWGVQIEETQSSREREGELISRARAHLVDGLILNPTALETSSILEQRGLPPVVLMGEVEQDRFDQVLSDSRGAARDLTEHLIRAGCRRIAVVGTTETIETATARLREEGHRDALAAAGIPFDPSLMLALDFWTIERGRAVLEGFLSAGGRVDAVLCFTDDVALGALSALTVSGYRVPEDVLVAGIDDVPLGRYTSPPLTTVAWDKRLVTRLVLDALERRIDERTLPAERTVVAHRLIERESTRRAAS